ncbi:hypothetical protein HELRODRAFT_183929 [Helobdella robusta]|uniref:Homeobox domain-containing protein n=1 Tax=Helobdella robusta TaxID=6412 RepID=T1FKB2_HELRO|nr:hypothetical protein HELRODRAFT_183929 [Helobdella robusta]ESO09712.1 hypothetical protein HELRODRAFT_183929 [Helobdella robusta]
MVIFTKEQLMCICEVLLKECKYDKLRELLVSNEFRTYENDIFALARIKVHLHYSEYDSVYHLIMNRFFNKCYHKELQTLWDEAHYRQYQTKKATDKFLIRKKHPYPATIWDGEGESYGVKVRVRMQLNKSFQMNHYPKESEKVRLCRETSLTRVQVNTWFKNKRHRFNAKNFGKNDSDKDDDPIG